MTFFVTFLTISVVPPALTADQSDFLLVVVVAWSPYPERLHPNPHETMTVGEARMGLLAISK